ncbi:MerR family DNA-binding transcriptional regulator [Streptomyces sp. NPDC005760]|uniref:MerR family transcriptional regulator n=1 Tax=Streptomyces sp. NPDC005760 TaxID=3156718 RepID=UPI0033F5713B
MKSSGDNGVSAMSIGALAARFGLATHVLRHWESMGLLHPVHDRRALYPARDPACRGRRAPIEDSRVS